MRQNKRAYGESVVGGAATEMGRLLQDGHAGACSFSVRTSHARRSKSCVVQIEIRTLLGKQRDHANQDLFKKEHALRRTLPIMLSFFVRRKPEDVLYEYLFLYTLQTIV